MFDVNLFKKIIHVEDKNHQEHFGPALIALGDFYGFSTLNANNEVELSVDILEDIKFLESFYKNDEDLLKKLNIDLSQVEVKKINVNWINDNKHILLCSEIFLHTTSVDYNALKLLFPIAVKQKNIQVLNNIISAIFIHSNEFVKTKKYGKLVDLYTKF